VLALKSNVRLFDRTRLFVIPENA